MKRAGILVLMFIVCVTSTVGAQTKILNVPFYSQTTGGWENEQMGCGHKILKHGCFMVSAAMVLKYYGHDFDPKSFNEWLIEHDGYIGCDFVWKKIRSFHSYCKKFESEISAQQIVAEIDEGNPVIAATTFDGAHWYVIVGYEKSGDNIEFWIHDPWHSSGPEKSSYTLAGNYRFFSEPNTITPPVPPNIRQLFEQFYNDNGGAATFGQPWDNGSGTDIHLWPGEGGPDALYVQDFLKGSIWSQLVYNPDLNEVFAIFNKILIFWNANYGYSNYGPPTNNEYACTYTGGQYGQHGDEIVVQKFSKTGSNPFKTIIWNSQTGQTSHSPVGCINILQPAGALCYVWSNNQWVRWPNIWTTIPTGEWLVDIGSYNFVFKDEHDKHLGSLTVPVMEGNHENVEPDLPEPPENNPILAISITTLDFGTTEIQKNFGISNTGTGDLNWTVNDDQWWMSCEPISGTNDGVIAVTVNRSVIASPGTYSGFISINSNGGQKHITVTIVKQETPLPPSPPSEPTNLSGSITYNSSIRKLKLTGELFNGYTHLIVAGGQNVLIKKTIYNGYEFTVPSSYDHLNIAYGPNGNNWFWPGRNGCHISEDGIKWQDGWYWLEESQSPPPPPVDPPTEPTNLSGSISYDNQTEKLKLTGELFNGYTHLIVAGGQNVLIKKTIYNGYEFTVPSSYDHLNIAYGPNGNNWFWPGRNGCHISEDGIKWQDGWYWLEEKGTSSYQTTGVDSKTESTVTKSLLYQNYPNPFNPITHISYQITCLEKVKLTIFDLLGQQVAVLVDEKQQPGRYQVAWLAADQPAGIYICQLAVGGKRQTKKMILVK